MRPSSFRMRGRRAGAALLLLAAHGLGLAQDTAPNTKEMVEALTPRTRSLRNLVVGEAAASAPGAQRIRSAGWHRCERERATPNPSPGCRWRSRFDFDSARLRPEGVAILDQLAAALQTAELKDNRFLIESHTDAKGGADYNQRLSHITLRRDEAATNEGIASAIRELGERTLPGDRVFVYWSGHGSRSFDAAEGGCVESLVPYDLIDVTNRQLSRAGCSRSVRRPTRCWWSPTPATPALRPAHGKPSSRPAPMRIGRRATPAPAASAAPPPRSA